jgi:hypothetical protein
MGYCQQLNDVPGSARLMRIMANQANILVSTAKLPDGQHTETGKETLKEFRAHFPHSKMTDDSYEGEGQENLGICERITNRGDWNLATRVINQKFDER